MSAKKVVETNHKRLHTYQQSNEFHTYSKDVSNWKSVLCVHTKKKQMSLNEIECGLQKYFSNHMFIIEQISSRNNFIDKQTFEKILRNSDVLIDHNTLEILWNSCQPSEEGISYENFCQRFAPFNLENKQNSSEKNLSPRQSQILNYVTCIDQFVKKSWEDLKEDFISLDRYGRLFITIDQAINLMKKYSFPLNDKQQCELALLFSPKNSGQFKYFDFMQSFNNRLISKNLNQSIFSRSTYFIQTKQSWTNLSITIDDILNRIRSECINKYESIHRMFQKFDQNHQGHLTLMQFNQLIKQFNIQLNDEEFYHLISEIDKSQDGIISYDELYGSIITNAL